MRSCPRPFSICPSALSLDFALDKACEERPKTCACKDRSHNTDNQCAFRNHLAKFLSFNVGIYNHITSQLLSSHAAVTPVSHDPNLTDTIMDIESVCDKSHASFPIQRGYRQCQQDFPCSLYSCPTKNLVHIEVQPVKADFVRLCESGFNTTCRFHGIDNFRLLSIRTFLAFRVVDIKLCHYLFTSKFPVRLSCPARYLRFR